MKNETLNIIKGIYYLTATIMSIGAAVWVTKMNKEALESLEIQ